MEKATKKIISLLDKELILMKKDNRLSCSGPNWKKELDEKEKLSKKICEINDKIDSLVHLVSEDDFDEYFRDRLCIDYDDFLYKGERFK